MSDDRLHAVARLTDSLSRAGTLDEVYACALDALQSSLHVERASVLLFDEQGVMSFVAWRGLSDAYRSAVNGHTPWRPDSRDVNPIFVPDVFADPSLEGYATVFEQEGIRSLGFFPLTYRGGVIGKFMLYHGEPRQFTDAETELAQTIAGQIAFGVARIRAEAEVVRERNRLDDVISNAPGVVWESVTNPDGSSSVTFVSPQSETLLGYTPEEWRNDPELSDRIIKETVVISHGPPEIQHSRVSRKDGTEIWAEVRLVRKQEGGRIITRGVTVDITAQKLAARRDRFLSEASGVLASSLAYETTLAHVAQLCVADLADWCVIDVIADDGEIERLLVVHRHGKEDAARIAKEQRVSAHQTAFVRDVIMSGEPLFVPHATTLIFEETYPDRPELLSAVKELGLSSFMIVPLIAGGRALGAISLVSANRRFDSSDLELACELGRRAGYAVDNALLYRQAQEANRAKDDFLLTLSHELRTPMTATLGWASMLRKNELSPENFKLAVETIDRSTKAQARLIDDILDVSRIISGKMQLNIAPVVMQKVVESAVDAIRPSAAAKGLELRVELSDQPAVVSGDADRIQQVLWNLLSNGVKFSSSPGTISVTLHPPDRGRVHVSVEDQGIGISARFLPYVFERFRQAETGSSRTHGGLGLGLAIVRSILELHGGTVEASSEGVGCGARFTIRLPLASSMPRPRDLTSADEQQATPPVALPTTR
ncbi:MAG TPA: ATP-binding protein [Thermoanaerobaculia bacterium]